MKPATIPAMPKMILSSREGPFTKATKAECARKTRPALSRLQRKTKSFGPVLHQAIFFSTCADI